tara:strand:- start:889 stop:1875 length:987 start_codon:yes stop_codon:yes gene_type:complete
MKQKIRVGFIYKNDYIFLNQNHFDKTTYYFFMKALKRNSSLDVKFFCSNNKFDCSKLKGEIDVILLPNNNTDGTPDELIGIKKLGIPVICRTGDPFFAKEKNQFQFHEKWKIDYYFNFMHEEYFHEFYPKKFKYRTIIFGIEPELYGKLNYNFKDRINNKILNSGGLGRNNLKSRIANRILNPKKLTGWHLYKLRTLCNNLDCVIHTRQLEKKFPSSSYNELLAKYSAAIAATTFYPTIKYWETSASGCLTFMEITKLNRGEYLGYRDGENSIFINESNYEKKFQEYLSDNNNPKWEKIAKAGSEYTMKKFSNDEAVNHLANLMRELI